MRYKPENNSELVFSFPDGFIFDELDKQGQVLPEGMRFVDLVIEREKDVLLVEIKDPSHSKAPDKERRSYLKRLSDNSILAQELVPKARDSYTFMHLMERDEKPFRYIVLIGLDAFEPPEQKNILTGFKDRLMSKIRHEAAEPWKRKYIADCAVLSLQSWNENFPQWPVTRLSAVAGEGY